MYLIILVLCSTKYKNVNIYVYYVVHVNVVMKIIDFLYVIKYKKESVVTLQ